MTSGAPSIMTLGGKTPLIHPSAFVASGCRIIGDVEIGAESSIWYNCVLRGDDDRIRIGARSNIQDGSVIHVDSGGYSTEIGNDVLVGHMAMLHGCKLHDRAFVGLGTIVMNDCEIESDAMLAAGAMLTPGKRIPRFQLWAGRPAKYLRDLSEAEIAMIPAAAAHYVETAQRHRAEPPSL